MRFASFGRTPGYCPYSLFEGQAKWTGGIDSARLPLGLSLPCGSHLGYDVRHITYSLWRTHGWHTVAWHDKEIRNVHSYVNRGGLVSVSETHITSSGIKEGLLVPECISTSTR
jgi:hypothetical protein